MGVGGGMHLCRHSQPPSGLCLMFSISNSPPALWHWSRSCRIVELRSTICCMVGVGGGVGVGALARVRMARMTKIRTMTRTRTGEYGLPRERSRTRGAPRLGLSHPAVGAEVARVLVPAPADGWLFLLHRSSGSSGPGGSLQGLKPWPARPLPSELLS